MVKLYALFAILGAAGFACAQASVTAESMPTNQARVIEMGHAIAQEKCQSCHASGPSGVSPNPQAPPLRTLGQKYAIDALSEAFAEGVLVGHSNMPEFELEPAQVDALVTYIESIQPPNSSRAKKAKSG